MWGLRLSPIAALVLCGLTARVCVGQHTAEGATRHTLESGLHLLQDGKCGLAARAFRADVAGRPQAVDARLLFGIAADCSGDRPSVVTSFKQIWNYDLDPQQQTTDLSLVQTALQSGWRPEPRWAESQYLSALVFYRGGDYDTALRYLNSAQPPVKDSWSYYNLLGSIHLRRAQFTDAKVALAAALSRSNQQADTFYKLGTVALATEDNSQAIRNFREALHLRPSFPAASAALGIALLQAGDAEGAREFLVKGTSIGPEIYVYLGEAYERLNNPDAAIEAYEKAALGNPRLFEAVLPLGRLLLKKGQSEKAEKYLRSATEIHPDGAQAQLYLGLALVATGHSDSAKDAAQHARETGQNEDAAFQDALGTLFKSLDQTEDAEQSFSRAVHLDPTREDYVRHLVATQVSTLDERALATVREGIAQFPKSAHLHYLLGMTLLNRGAAREAAEEARKATDLEPANAEYLQSLGVCLATLERDREAMKVFREVLTLKSDYTPALLQIGSLQLKAGDVVAAEQSFKQALDADPEYAPAYFRLGKIYYDRGDDAHALPLLEKARELDPDWEDTYFLLGMLYRRKGDPEKGNNMLEVFRKKKNDLQNTRRTTYDKANPALEDSKHEKQP